MVQVMQPFAISLIVRWDFELPKAKSTQVITHRIEFQQTEREALEMVAASITARNVASSVENLTKGVGNLMTPVLSASAAGVAAALGIIAWWEIRDLENEKSTSPQVSLLHQAIPLAGWISGGLQPSEHIRKEATPEQKAQTQEERRNFRAKLSQFRNAISTSILNLAGKV